MAHELRSPLHVAQLALTVLRQDREGDGDGRHAHFKRLSHALTSLGELIDNALLEARLSDALPLHHVRTTAEALVDDALQNVTP